MFLYYAICKKNFIKGDLQYLLSSYLLKPMLSCTKKCVLLPSGWPVATDLQ